MMSWPPPSGRVVLTSDRAFVAGEKEGTADGGDWPSVSIS